MKRLNGKVAVITGGASGIGAATARLFTAEGAAVVVADLNEEGGREVVRSCSAASRATFVRAGVTRGSDVRDAIAAAHHEYGRLDVLFNNAGLGGALGPIEETSTDDWDRTFAVLVRSVFLGVKHAVREMRGNGGGSIISTASVAGLRGGAGPHAYSAAKAAVVNLTRSLALELAKDHVRINCICPGGINTPLISNRLGGTDVADQVLAQLQPIGRAGRPEDIAGMALYLASDESSFVTGTAMVVDGGLTAGGGNLVRQGALEIPPGYSGPSFEQADRAELHGADASGATNG